MRGEVGPGKQGHLSHTLTRLAAQATGARSTCLDRMICPGEHGCVSDRACQVAVVGAGPAGMTAGVYLARAAVPTVVITQDIGGQAAWGPEIENYLGFRFISGVELVNKFYEHLSQFPQIRQEFGRVQRVRQEGNDFVLESDAGEWHTQAVIWAAGRSPRKLGVPGETEYLGRGVSYCSTCDGPLFAGKRVVIAGGGNAGFASAVHLKDVAQAITVLEVRDEVAADAAYQRRLAEGGKAQVLTGTRITAIHGNGGGVAGVSIENVHTGEKRELDTQGVFVEIGSLPNSEPVVDLVELNAVREIMINCRTETRTPGLFAAGDVTDVPSKQIIVAAGEGAKAALAAADYLVRKD